MTLTLAVSHNNLQCVLQGDPISPSRTNSHPLNSVGIPHHPATGLAVTHLERLAEDLISNSLAASTKISYTVSQSKFISFCIQVGVPALPTKEQILILFVPDLSQQLCPSSVRSYLALSSSPHTYDTRLRTPIMQCTYNIYSWH